jgi:hypothetical protein
VAANATAGDERGAGQAPGRALARSLFSSRT